MLHPPGGWSVAALVMVALGHAGAGLQLLAGVRRNEVLIIFELLSQQQCPASTLLLLHSRALGLLGVSGAALALASAPEGERPRSVCCGMAAGAAASLGQLRLDAAATPAAALQCGTIVASLSCARATHVAARRRGTSPRDASGGSPSAARLRGWRVARPRAPRAPRRVAATAAGALTLVAGAAAIAAPGASAELCFDCIGASRVPLSRAVRSTAATVLLPLGAGRLALEAGVRAEGASAMEGSARRRLALTVAAGGVAQAALLARSAHAVGLKRWARRALIALMAAVSF